MQVEFDNEVTGFRCDVKSLADFVNTMSFISRAENAFQLRRRMNPHHLEEAVNYETMVHERMQKIRLEACKLWWQGNASDITPSSNQKVWFDIMEKLVQQDLETAVFGVIDEQD